MEKAAKLFEKYKYVLLILLAGILLCLIPTGTKKTVSDPETSVSELFSLQKTQEEMEKLLAQIDGVGQVKVMLTLKSGSTLQLAKDKTMSEREAENKEDTQIVKLNRGNGCQDVVITQQTYPIYQGAVVVCEGADHSQVQWEIIQAVTVLTGLSSEKISVVKWK